MQTGVQFLTGFLVTLPFQARFHALSSTDRAGYTFFGLAVVAVVLLFFDVVHGMTAGSPIGASATNDDW